LSEIKLENFFELSRTQRRLVIDACSPEPPLE